MLNRKTLYAAGILALLVPVLIISGKKEETPSPRPYPLRFPRTSVLYGHEDLKVPFEAPGLSWVLTQLPEKLKDYREYVPIIRSVKLVYFPQLFPCYYSAELSGCFKHPVTGDSIPLELTDKSDWPEFTESDYPWNF